MGIKGELKYTVKETKNVVNREINGAKRSKKSSTSVSFANICYPEDVMKEVLEFFIEKGYTVISTKQSDVATRWEINW